MIVVNNILPRWTLYLGLDDPAHKRPVGELQILCDTAAHLHINGALPLVTTPASSLSSKLVGTAGNLALLTDDGLYVTPAGGHKGMLEPKHFVRVVEVDFKHFRIYARTLDLRLYPSTDTPIMFFTLVYGFYDVWVHHHIPITTKPAPYSMHLNYPAIHYNDFEAMRGMLNCGWQNIILTGHTSEALVPDASIIIGTRVNETCARAERWLPRR